MIRKLVSIGNGDGIEIDQSLLARLELDPDAELELSTDGKRIIIEPLGAKREGSRKPGPAVGEPDDPVDPEPRYGFPAKEPW